MATVLDTARPAAHPRPRFTSDQYEQLIDMGLLADGHYELLDGEIVKKMTQNPDHVFGVGELIELLLRQLVGQAVIREQAPLRLAEGWTPEPDVLVLRWRADKYRKLRFTAADVLILIEVSDTTLDTDQHYKGPRYALAGVPEYWIVNVTNRIIEVYTLPEGDHYTQAQEYGPDDTLTSPQLPGLTITVADIVG